MVKVFLQTLGEWSAVRVGAPLPFPAKWRAGVPEGLEKKEEVEERDGQRREKEGGENIIEKAELCRPLRDGFLLSLYPSHAFLGLHFCPNMILAEHTEHRPGFNFSFCLLPHVTLAPSLNSLRFSSLLCVMG